MTRTFVSTSMLSTAVVLAATAGCGEDDASDRIRRGTGSSDGSDAGTLSATITREETLFRGLEPELQKKCGTGCHADGSTGSAPTFLAPPDAYKSVKGHPGLVTKDTFESQLLQKPPHLGPGLSQDIELETKVKEWLDAEALAIQSIKKPATNPIAIVEGPNDLDLADACIGGLKGVHMKFTAGKLGSALSLSAIKLVVPAGTDVHVLKPRFIKVLAAPIKGNTEVPDPAHSFENIDQTMPNGQETQLGPGYAIFTALGGFDFATEKLKLEVEKLEPGKVQVIEPPKVCKNVPGFTANVLPSLRGQAGGFLVCSNCHGDGLAGLALNSGDQTLVCNQVLSKLSAPPNLANSLIVNKVTLGPHSGGITPNAGNFAAVFTNNAAVFF